MFWPIHIFGYTMQILIFTQVWEIKMAFLIHDLNKVRMDFIKSWSRG
jgi:hypothetical protein